MFAVLAVVQGRKETVAFKKTIPTSIVRRSLAVTVIGFGTLILFSVLLLATNPLSLSDGVFEVTSAIATVGLVTGRDSGAECDWKIDYHIMYVSWQSGTNHDVHVLRTACDKPQLCKIADAEIIVG